MQINYLPDNLLLSGLSQDTHVLFRVSASLFTVNVSVKQITVDHSLEYPSQFNPRLNLSMYLMARLLPTSKKKHLYFKPNCSSS